MQNREKKIKLVFMGTPEFAIPSLEKLCQAGIEIAVVVTVPDKPSGRGQQVHASAVKSIALTKGLTVLQPNDLRDPSFLQQLKSFSADLFVVIAFRILPPEVFTIPNLGTINLHASLLPKYRGAAPINWAIIEGERETGVTTFFIEEKVDTGQWLLQRPVLIGSEMTAGELHDQLADVGAETLLQTIHGVVVGGLKPKPQVGMATRAPKLTKEMGHVDWHQPAQRIHNLVRGLSPFPGAFSYLHGKHIKILRTRLLQEKGKAGNAIGSIIGIEKSGEIVITTDDGPLEIVELQPEGRRAMTSAEFLRGHPLSIGDQLE